VRWRSTLAAAVAGLALAGCGGGGPSSIVLYNGQHLELTQAQVSAFKQATGISVALRTNDGVVLADQIVQEGHSSPADVYFTENSPELVNLSEHGLLARLPQAVLSQVPARYRSPDGRWVGVALRVSSLVYDPKLIARSQLPRSILDLAASRWQGKVAIAPLDSDFPPVVGAIIATHGATTAAHWVDAMKRNAVVYQDEESVVSAVNSGSVPVGVINQYYWYRLQREVGADGMRSTLYYFPNGDPGSVVNVSGAAVLASSRQRADADRFVAFLVSRAGQQSIARGDDFEYPVRSDVAPNPQLPPLASVAHASINAAALGTDVPASQLIVRAGFGS
jgi:iron(III) transport system substrate-binding protein